MNIIYVIGIILCASTIIPIILINKNKHRKDVLMCRNFSELTKNAVLCEQESWNGHSIALDKINKILYFIRQQDTNCISQIVDLKTIHTCNYSIGKSVGSNVSSVDTVELLLYKDDEDFVSLLFYDYEIDGFILNGELQSAERWKKICSQVL